MKKGPGRSRQKQNMFLYRVEIRGRDGKIKRHLAEAAASCDECARRKIIHKTLADGGRVVTIYTTDDRSCYPGETAKQVYTGKDC